MNSPGARQLLDAVERVTGYRVAVDTIEGISEDAQMISARPELPAHSIRINKNRLPYADYIAAVQCAMLLRLWSDPKRLPVFSPFDDKVRHLADRVAKTGGLAQLPAAAARQTAEQMVRGLLNQLRSMPIEILTIRDCYDSCPDLRSLQEDSVADNLRRLSENLSPKIRSFAPDDLWRNSVSMTSAYALNWSQLTGSTLAMLPYQSAGFAEAANRLLAELHAHPAKNSESYTSIVDAWATALGLRSLYVWESRNGRQ